MSIEVSAMVKNSRSLGFNLLASGALLNFQTILYELMVLRSNEKRLARKDCLNTRRNVSVEKLS